MTALPRPGPHYHVGIVVPDLDAARAHFHDLIGVTWGDVMSFEHIDLRDADGADLALPMRFCYSVEAPHLELIQETPGSVWVCNEHSNLHHVGFWTSDLAGESAALSEAGCPLQLCGRTGSTAPVTFSYHRDPLGVRIELVDAALLPMMEELMFRPSAG